MIHARPSPESEQFASQVRGMFDRVAGVYDIGNAAMSVGMHHRWRERAGEWTGLGPGDAALDVCCGTGDLTFELQRRVGPQGTALGSDFSDPMLDLAREKAFRLRANEPVPKFEWGDALELPYDDDSFDAVTVGFGVRNLDDLGRGISELCRVLRPGGRLVILEITRPQRPPFSTFFSVWFDRLVPIYGKVIGDAGAYGYLPESVKRFSLPAGLAEMMDRVGGLEQIRWTILGGGIIAIHSGVKPELR